MVDLASDKVNSRIVGASIFLIIPAYLMHLFVGRTMKFANVPSDNKDPASIELFNLPTSGGFVLGEALQYPVYARVLNNNSYPIVGLPVYAKVQIISYRDPDMSTLCNVISTSSNSLQAKAVEDLCKFEAVGTVESTNNDGIATFSRLRIVRGVPSSIKVEFYYSICSGNTEPGSCKTPLFRNVTLMVSLLPGTISLVPMNHAPEFVLTGESFSNQTAPCVQAIDGAGNPVKDVPIIAFIVSNISLIDVRSSKYSLKKTTYIIVGAHPKLASDYPKYAYMSNAMQLTDSKGIALFLKLGVQGANSRSHVMGFFAFGVFAVWNRVEADPAGNGIVHEFALVEPEDSVAQGRIGFTMFPLRAVPRDAGQEDPWATRGSSMEGDPIGNMYVMIGNPIGRPGSRRLNVREGKRAVAVAVPYQHPNYDAEITQAIGTQLAPQAILQTRKWKKFKTLENALSAPSNMDGFANFTEIRFSVGGAPGLYRIRFFVNGNEDPEIFLWEVKSSVARVEINVSQDIQVEFSKQGYFGCLATDPVFGCVSKGYVLKPSSVSICAKQDEYVRFMQDQKYIPIQQQTAETMLQASLGAAFATNPSRPCWALAALSQVHPGAYIVRITDSRGQGLEGKDVSLFVRPDNDPLRPPKSAFPLPTNPRVGFRSSWTELGGGDYLIDASKDLRVLWVLPPTCRNCSNGPFEYSFSAEGMTPTAISNGGARFLRFVLSNFGVNNTNLAEEACGIDTEYPTFLKMNVLARNGTNGTIANATTVNLELGSGLCADVVVLTPLPSKLVAGKASETPITFKAINASGYGLYAREICFGWDDDGLDDSICSNLARFKDSNPLRRKFDNTKLNLCGDDVNCKRTEVVKRSGGLCNMTMLDGTAQLSGITIAYPVQLMKWFLFLRDEGLGHLGSDPASSRGKCLKERLLLPHCQSDWFWTFVDLDVFTVRYVNMSSRTAEGLISPIRYPPPTIWIPDGAVGEVIMYLDDRAGSGVQERQTAVNIVSHPGFSPSRQNDNTSLAVFSGTVEATVTSLQDLICIDGEGCNDFRKLTDPGFGRLKIKTTPGILGTYFVRHDVDRAAIKATTWPARLFDTYPEYTQRGLLELVTDPMYGLLPVQESFEVKTLSVGSSFPYRCAVRITGFNALPAAGYRVRTVVEKSRDCSNATVSLNGIGAWEATTSILLRNEWTIPSDNEGVASCQQSFGIDWVDVGTACVRLIFGIFVGTELVIQSAPTTPFLVSCPDQGLTAEWIDQPNSRMLIGEHAITGQHPVLSVKLRPNRTVIAYQMQHWRPPPLQIILVDMDADSLFVNSSAAINTAKKCKLQADMQLVHSDFSSYTDAFIIKFEDIFLVSCLTGLYGLTLRAYPESFMPFSIPFAFAQFPAGTLHNLSSMSVLAPSIPMRASSHGVIALEVVIQPPVVVETLVPFLVAARLFGQGMAPISNSPVVCTIVDLPAWPATYAAFDSGGRLGQLAPRTNTSNSTNENGIAYFSLILARGDPTTPISLRFTSYFASVQTRSFRLRHHFKSLVVVKNVSFDVDKASLYTVPMGTITLNPAYPRDPKTNQTTRPLRMQGVLISTDPSLDAFTLAGPVLAVYDHAGLMVPNLGQVCKAAGCYNTLRQELAKPGAIQLRIRWYLVSWNGSLVDGVLVQQTHDQTLPEKPGYWWLAPRFIASVPSGFYRAFFEVDGLWVLQEAEVYVLNNRAINIGNILPFDRQTLLYYGCLVTLLLVPLFNSANDPDASTSVRRIAMCFAVLSTLNLWVFTSLNPPCDPDITNPYGCTHLNRDPADSTVYPRTVWQQFFSAFALIVQFVMVTGVLVFNSLWLKRLLPEVLAKPFSEVRHVMQRSLAHRILLPENMLASIDDEAERTAVQPFLDVGAKELWYEGAERTPWEARKQWLVDKRHALYVWIRQRIDAVQASYHRQVVRRMPFRHTLYQRMSHFKYSQRVLLSVTCCTVLLAMMQYVMAAQYNRLAAMLDQSRPLAFGELAAVLRYALDETLASVRAGEGEIPPPAGDDLPADMRPYSRQCDSTQSVVRPLALIRDIQADPASQLSFVCLLRNFNMYLIQITNTSLSSLARSTRQAAWWNIREPPLVVDPPSQQQTLDLVNSARMSVVLAVLGSMILTAAAALGLMFSYREDAMAAREGCCRKVRERPEPLGAAMLVGTQTVALGVGWLVFFLGLFAVSFSMIWAPLRRYVIDLAKVPVIIVLALLGLVIFPGALLRALRKVSSHGDWEMRLQRAKGLFTAPLVQLRGQWAWYELAGTLLHLALGFAAAAPRGAVSLAWQFFRVPRLDVPTRTRGFDPGHSAYVSMVEMDRVINSPLAASLAEDLHRELLRRFRLRATPVTVLAAEIAASDGAVDVLEIEQDRRTLQGRRGVRLPVAKWHLALVMAANSDRRLHRSRKAVPAVGFDPNSSDRAVLLRWDADPSDLLPASENQLPASADNSMAGTPDTVVKQRQPAISKSSRMGIHGTIEKAGSQELPTDGQGDPLGNGGEPQEQSDPRYGLGRLRYGRRVPDDYG